MDRIDFPQLKFVPKIQLLSCYHCPFVQIMNVPPLHQQGASLNMP